MSGCARHGSARPTDGKAGARFRPARAARRCAGLALILLAITPVGAAGPCRPLTIDAIVGGALHPPAPSSFLWSPDGTRVAWIETMAETRTLRLHDLRSGKTRSLMPLEPSPGAPRGLSFDWSPDGRALVVSSGGDLWSVALAEGTHETRRLTETPENDYAPRWSPDGVRVGFVRDADLFVVEVAAARERRITDSGGPGRLNGRPDWVYEEELRLHHAWWWDDHGSRIAYLQFDQEAVPRYPIVDWSPPHGSVQWQHYPKAGDRNATVRLGVVSLEAAAGPVPVTRWMGLSREEDIYIPRVAWISSNTLAVQRLDRAQERLDLLRCDPSTGACTVVMTETDPHWINIEDDLHVIPAGRHAGGFVRTSERDGWRHIERHTPDGASAQRLTGGAWAVTDLAGVDAAGGHVYFTATRDGALERHLYRVPIDGGDPIRLTRDPGWHVTWPSPSGTSWIDQHSTATRPPVTRIVTSNGTSDLIAGTVENPLAGVCLGTVDFLDVPAADDTPLPAVMIRPADFDPKRRYPVLVYVYGGPRSQRVRNGWEGERSLWHHMLASRGTIVWTLDNRGSGGRGHAWETPVDGRLGVVEMADQKAGVQWLKKRPWVDPRRFGVWGWSYGGTMTLHALFHEPDLFRTGIAVAPVTDWRNYDTIYTERYLGLPSENPDGYRRASPRHHVAGQTAPLFLVHGTADDNVHMQNAIHLLEDLVAAGKPVRFMLYPGRRHGLEGREARGHLYRAMTAFLLETL